MMSILVVFAVLLLIAYYLLCVTTNCVIDCVQHRVVVPYCVLDGSSTTEYYEEW